MQRVIPSIFILLLSLSLNSQTFSHQNVKNYKNSEALFNTSENVSAKVVFVEENTVFLHERGVLADNVTVKAGDVFSLQGFTQEDFEYTYKQKDYTLPYLKIKKNSETYWLHGVYPFIFDDANPIISFKANGIQHNLYSAKKLQYVEDGNYIGYEVLIMKNTATDEYKFLTCNDFPKALYGHSYGSPYAYLQNDMGVVEKIKDVVVDDTKITLDVQAQYQEGSAVYKISFDVSKHDLEAEYSRIQLAQ